MNLATLLTNLEAGKISAEQAQGEILEILAGIQMNNSIVNNLPPCEYKDGFQCAIDCVRIRLGVPESEATHV